MGAAPKGFPSRDDLVVVDGVVLRRHDDPVPGAIEWIHDALSRLASTSFPVPEPVGYFDGASVAVVDGFVWSAVSYLPGDVVGWSAEPDLARLGAFLASFHDATSAIEMTAQRPGAFPVDELLEIADDLRRIHHDDRARTVVHGDMTAHNVVAQNGEPCGAIDFMNTYVEVPLFDLGCALWRTGRPTQEAQVFDPDRIAAYVDGYDAVRPLSGEDRAAVVVYLEARGLQIVAKQRARGVVDHGPERRLDWLRRHRHELVSVLIP